MTQCTEMIGELEIIATCRTLRRIIEIVVDDAVIRYGDDCEEQCPIRLKFIKIDEDVRHYDCLININEIFCDGGRPTENAPVTSTAPSNRLATKIQPDKMYPDKTDKEFVTPVMLSPVTTMAIYRAAISARRRTSRSEVLTSSPYKDKLSVAQSKAPAPPAAGRNKRIRSGPARKKSKLNKSARHDALRTAHGNTDKDRWYCPICDEDQKDDMIKCIRCGKWIHSACAGGIPPK